MSEETKLRYLLAELDKATRTEQAVIAEEAILRLFHDLRAELAASQAEVERLRGIIRKVEWVTHHCDYPISDSFQACPLCDNDYLLGHHDTCPFYQWEGGKG